MLMLQGRESLLAHMILTAQHILNIHMRAAMYPGYKYLVSLPQATLYTRSLLSQHAQHPY